MIVVVDVAGMLAETLDGAVRRRFPRVLSLVPGVGQSTFGIAPHDTPNNASDKRSRHYTISMIYVSDLYESVSALCSNDPSYSAGMYAPAGNTGTIYSGNRHHILRTLPQWLIPSVPSDSTDTIAGSRHYRGTTTVLIFQETRTAVAHV